MLKNLLSKQTISYWIGVAVLLACIPCAVGLIPILIFSILLVLLVLKVVFWKWLYAVVAALQAFGFVSLFCYEFSFSFGTEKIHFTISLIGGGLLFSHLYFNADLLSYLKRKIFSDKSNSPVAAVIVDSSKFLAKMETKSDQELKTIIQNTDMTEGARAAAKQVLETREIKADT